jgi:hypothetical protein
VKPLPSPNPHKTPIPNPLGRDSVLGTGENTLEPKMLLGISGGLWFGGDNPHKYSSTKQGLKRVNKEACEPSAKPS